MTFSLYAATVPSYRQILGAVSGLLGTAEAFCTEKGIAPHDILRWKGLPIGKRDFMGKTRRKKQA